MANQGPARREVLEMLAKASIASQFPGFSRWVFAGQAHTHPAETANAPARAVNYKPHYFTADEYRTVDIVTEIIIPRDESPGAHDAGVAEFIDFMAAHGDQNIQQPLRSGLAWLNAQARASSGKAFADLPASEQPAILKSLAYKDAAAKADPTGEAFFRLIRRYTVMGYYTSRAGLEELNYPGLKLYSQSPACPHKDDPEHLHLSPARI